MSAIFGVWSRAGEPINEIAVGDMSETLVHRGPDGVAVLIRGSVALGHRMLHTTAECLADLQPLEDTAGSLLLCCDARLDNREELISLTELRGRDARAVADSELILAAYRRWGADCVEHLLGDFAIAIWDERERRLLLARDPMGVRSLYYMCNEKWVVFATEIKALLAHPAVESRVDRLRVAQYLEVDVRDTERTFFEGISRVPAAHRLLVQQSSLRKDRYWRLNPKDETRLSGDSEYAAALLEKFSKSVARRLRSSLPVGAALSGGLDSSGIACVARSMRSQSPGDRLLTFSAVFPDLPENERRLADETEFIESVLAMGGFRRTFVRADSLGPFHDVDRMLYHADEPILGYNLYMHWGLYEAARSAGVRVFLDGFDGDACIGYGRELLEVLAREGRWDAFERELRALATTHEVSATTLAGMVDFQAARVLSAHARNRRLMPLISSARQLAKRFGGSMSGLLVRHCAGPVVSRLRRDWFWSERVPLVVPGPANAASGNPPRHSVIRNEFARSVSFSRGNAEQGRANAASPAESHARSLESPVFQQALDLADKSAAAFGIEARYPFFDRELLEFCVSLPVEQKLSAGIPRVVFRRAMQGILPADVQRRVVKQDLSPAFVRGVRAHSGKLRELLASESWLTDVVDGAAMLSRCERLENGQSPGRAIADAMAVFRVLVLARWPHDPGRRSTG